MAFLPCSNWISDSSTYFADCLIRALNCILLQARNVGASGSQTDIADFVTFSAAVVATIEEHHHTEETLMFPLFEQHSRPGQ